MRLLDTDVMIDILNGFPTAVEWLHSLAEDEELGLPGFVVMELLDGCRDKREINQLMRSIDGYRVYWPGEEDCNRALADFAQGHLSHNLGMLDALIGECAVGLEVPLCTFNIKHFKAVSALSTEQPYVKSPL